MNYSVLGFKLVITGLSIGRARVRREVLGRAQKVAGGET